MDKKSEDLILGLGLQIKDGMVVSPFMGDVQAEFISTLMATFHDMVLDKAVNFCNQLLDEGKDDLDEYTSAIVTTVREGIKNLQHTEEYKQELIQQSIASRKRIVETTCPTCNQLHKAYRTS